MIPIIIDTRPLVDQFALSRLEVDNLIDESVKYIASKFAEYWELAAQRKLKSSRERYINNLKVIDTGRMQGAVVLDYTSDTMVKFIEEGVGAFDMKQGFATSSKKKTTKNGGWYLTIPFRLATPGAKAESSIFSGVMPASIYKIAKDEGIVSVGLAGVPDKYKVKSSRPAVTNLGLRKSFDEYSHKSNIYAGIQKQVGSDGKGMYMSFRRVSSNSDDMSWIHTGINAYNLANDAMSTLNSNFQFEMGKAIDIALDSMGYE